MTTLNSGSAKIYTFPARGRFASGEQSSGSSPAADLARVATTACGSAWYHDEAIQESEQPLRRN